MRLYLLIVLVNFSLSTWALETVSRDDRFLAILGDRVKTHQVFAGSVCQSTPTTGELCWQCVKMAFATDGKNVFYFSKVWEPLNKICDANEKNVTVHFESCLAPYTDSNSTFLETDFLKKEVALNLLRKIDVSGGKIQGNRCTTGSQFLQLSPIVFDESTGDLGMGFSTPEGTKRYYINIHKPTLQKH